MSFAGVVYEATARPKTAFHYYSRSLETAERGGGDVAGQVRVWIDLGRLLTNAGVPAGRQSAAAAACYRAALRLTTTGGDVARRPVPVKQRRNDVTDTATVLPLSLIHI